MSSAASAVLLCAFQVDVAHELYRAQLFAAESAIRLDEHAVARAWLDEVDATRRGFEWRVHDASLDQALASWKLAAGHVNALALSPDGNLLACGTDMGVLELRDARSGDVKASIAAHTQAVTDVHFDARGERVVTTSYDRTAKVFDVATAAQLVEFKGHAYPIGGAVFSPDGSILASCAYERPPGTVVGTVRVWNAADGSVVRTLEGGRKPLVDIAFSPDGKRVAAASWDFCLFVWSIDGGEPVELAVPDEGIYNAVDGVAWSPDGARIACASKDKTARIWDVTSGALIATLRGHTDAVSKLAFAPDGATLATASADGSVRLWTVADSSTRAVLRGHGDDVIELAFSPDGAQLTSCSSDGTLRIWDARTGLYGGARVETSAAPYVASYGPFEALIATASFDGRIQLWDAATLEPLASWAAHPENKSCHALGWSADGRRLVSGSWEPVVRVWDAFTRTELAHFEQADGTNDLAVSPDGKRAAACSGKSVQVYDLVKLERAFVFTGHTSTALGINFSADSRWCASTGRDGKALVWDAATGALRCEIAMPTPDVSEAQFTADGAQLVIAGRDGTLVLHDAASGARVRELAHHSHGIDHIDISPDGSRVAFAADVVAFVDMASGGIVGQLRPHREHPYNLDFDAHGARLISCSTDRSVVVSDVRPLREQLQSRAEALALRARIEPELRARLAGGASVAALADEMCSATCVLPSDERAAWIALLATSSAH